MRGSAVGRLAKQILADLDVSSRNWKRLMVSTISLLASGMVAALVFMLLSSERLHAFPAATVVFIILFVQWETFALTIAKMGIEQVIFATVSQDRSIRFGLRRFILSRTVPLALASGIVAGYVFSPLAGLCLSLAVILDSCALSMAADLNARERFGTTAFSNIMNYPLFFVGILVAAYSHQLSHEVLVLAFLLSSATRCAWLLLKYRGAAEGLTLVRLRSCAPVAVQQGLNYLLFKGDQLLLAGFLFLNFASLTLSFSAQYVFLAKFPELIAGVITVVGVVIFPRIGNGQGSRGSSGDYSSGALVRLSLAVGAFIMLGFVLYQPLWSGDPLPWFTRVPFLLQALAIFPANAVTYNMLRLGHLQELLRGLMLGLLPGLLLVLASVWLRQPALMPWVVVAQLWTFLLATVRLPVGDARALYEAVAPQGATR